MTATMVGRWPVQLRLGLEGVAGGPDVAATLEVEDRQAVVACLAGLMMKAAATAASGQGGNDDSQGNQDQGDGGCKIA
jgi:hypothetical protein